MGSSKKFSLSISSTLLCLFGLLPSAPICSEPYYYRFEFPQDALLIVDEYLPHDPVIIDAGAYIGNETVVMAKRWPAGTLHAFEPVPYLYHRLTETTKHVENIYTYNFALSSSNGIEKMYLSVNDYAPEIPVMSSSLLPPKMHVYYAPEVIFPTQIPVYTYNLDSWAKAFNIDRIDMMWLDMQGVELNMLQACPEILRTTRVILTEVEFTESYEGQYLYKDVKRFLEKEGFVLVGGNFDPYYPRGDGSVFGDALFVRKELLNVN